MKWGVVITLAGTFWWNLAGRPVDAAEPTPAETMVVEMTIESQPLERWIKFLGTLFRAADDGDRATETAVGIRVIAAAAKVDTNRPLTMLPRLIDDGVNDMAQDEDALRVLLPLNSQWLTDGTKRLLLGPDGVRVLNEADRPEVGEIVYANAADGWVWGSPSSSEVSATERLAAVERFADGPDTFVRFRFPTGYLSAARKASFAAELQADLARDLVRGDDEPAKIHRLRTDIQTSLVNALIAIAGEHSFAELTLDTTDEFDTSAVWTHRWQDDGVVSHSLGELREIESQFQSFTQTPAVLRGRVHCELPPPIRRQINRWFHDAVETTVSLMNQAGRENLTTLATDIGNVLGPFVEQGRLDVVVDVVEADQYVALHGAIAGPGGALLSALEQVLAEKASDMRTIDSQRFFHLGKAGKPTPLGKRPTLWVTGTESAFYFFFGEADALPAFADRIASSQTSVQASANRQSVASINDPLITFARLHVDWQRLASVEQLSLKAQKRLALRALLNVDATVPPSEFRFGQRDGALVIDGQIPGELVIAFTKATLERDP